MINNVYCEKLQVRELLYVKFDISEKMGKVSWKHERVNFILLFFFFLEKRRKVNFFITVSN